jgi:hypothetical protein
MTRQSGSRATRRGIAGLAALTIGIGGSLALLAPTAANASSHREAPLISSDPTVDNTDVYAFVSPDDKDSVTLVANWIPFEEPAGGPNFYPFATDGHYDIHIDNNGDAKPDLTYRWTFTTKRKNPNTFLYNTGQVTSLSDPDLNLTQTYKLELVRGNKATLLAKNVPVAPSNVGKGSMPNYAGLRSQAVKGLPNGLTTFAGQSDDPFFLDLRVFDLLYGGNLSEVGKDTVSGYNVNTVVLKVPTKLLALKSDAKRNPVIGVWSTTHRRAIRVASATDGSGAQTSTGPWVQVSRLGQPLVNEIVVPVGQKDRFNASTPAKDGQFLKYVTNPELPKLIEALYMIPAPKTPRNDLVQVFLTGVPGLNAHSLNKDADPKAIRPAEELRLNMSIPPTAKPDRLGVLAKDNAGFPNGRRLTDDVLDIEVQAAEGVLLPNAPAAVKGLGDMVNNNDVPFGATFPYVGLPTSGSN